MNTTPNHEAALAGRSYERRGREVLRGLLGRWGTSEVVPTDEADPATDWQTKKLVETAHAALQRLEAQGFAGAELVKVWTPYSSKDQPAWHLGQPLAARNGGKIDWCISATGELYRAEIDGKMSARYEPVQIERMVEQYPEAQYPGEWHHVVAFLTTLGQPEGESPLQGGW